MNLVKLGEALYVPEDFQSSHHYYADEKGEKEYTGITTILGVLAKPALIGWAAKMACEFMEKAIKSGEHDLSDEAVLQDLLEEAKNAHRKKKEAAGEHGTDTHALIEKYINHCIENCEGKPCDLVDTATWGPIQKFLDWAKENVERFLFSERRMANPELFIAGTADFAYVGKDGKKYMADFKTSSGIYGIDYWLQVAAYRYLAEAEGDEKYDGATIVRLGKKGDFEVVHLYEYETFRDCFLACLTIYRAQAAIKGLTVK